MFEWALMSAGEPPLDAPRPGPGFTAAGIADRVRDALNAGDPEQIGALLSPDVQWGPPGSATPPCRNRRQVLDWYAAGRAEGRRATVSEVEVHSNALVVGLRLEDGHRRWQVLRVGPDGVNDIRGFENRVSAIGYLSP